MELGKFLQNNIMEFLDTKVEKKREHLSMIRSEEITLFSVDKDYASEVRNALAEGNLGKAKHIFDSLRDSYNNLRKSDDDRDKIYSILQEVYALIKEHFDSQVSGKTLQEEIDSIDLSALQQKSIKKPVKENKKDDSSQQETVEQARQARELESAQFEIAALKAMQLREQKDNEMTQSIAAVQEAINSGDKLIAVERYRLAKQLFSEYPSDDKFRKIEWYKSVMKCYEDIKAMTNPQSQSQEQIPTPNSQEEQTSTEAISVPLDDVKEKVRLVIEAVDKHELHTAESLLMDARHAIAGLDASHEKEKASLSSIVDKIVHRIQFLKMNKSQEEQANDTQVNQQVDEAYEKALQMYQSGKTKEAEAILVRILSSQPNHMPSSTLLNQIRSQSPTEDNQNGS